MLVTALQGDTVDMLCHRHLGSTAGITEAVLALNPGLAAIGPVLPMGTAVELPDTPTAPPRAPLIQLWN